MARAGVVYAREIEGKEYTFGVSGLLYRANVLMYDRQTESLWSQVKRRAVTGPLSGTRLKALKSRVTTWGKWRKKHPDTLVLSLDTGHIRDYSKDPYEAYYRSTSGLFNSFFRKGPGEEEKEMVVGVDLGGNQKAYPVEHLRREGTVEDSLGGVKLILSFDPETGDVLIETGEGEEIPPVIVYWFVWKGIHPESGLFRP